MWGWGVWHNVKLNWPLCTVILITEGINGVPLKSVFSKILAKKSVISKYKGKNR